MHAGGDEEQAHELDRCNGLPSQDVEGIGNCAGDEPGTSLGSCRRRQGQDQEIRAVSDKIEGSAEEALAKVQEIVASVVPDAHCELQDYQHPIGCGSVDQDGNVVDVVMLRRGLDAQQVQARAEELARKVGNAKEQETQEWLASMEPLPPGRTRVV